MNVERAAPRARTPIRAQIALAGLALAACGARAPIADAPLVDPHDGRTLVREAVVVAPAEPGIVIPYPLLAIISTFGDCRPGGRQHRGLDIAGAGPEAGLGTPIRAMVRSEIIEIARPEDDPRRYGRLDTRSGTVERDGMRLPRSAVLPSYGTVHFFTRDYGTAHTGAMVVTRARASSLAGYRIRYMHLGAVHPELGEGDMVEAGQELGLMGGTAVLESRPHVHIDIETTAGTRVDVAPYLGLPADTRRCGSRS